jgi:hypothetical protein
MHGNSTRENRETPSTPVVEDVAGRLEKALSPKSNMHVDGESDGRIVPTKCPNNGEQPPAEDMEGRRPTKENIGQATAFLHFAKVKTLFELFCHDACFCGCPLNFLALDIRQPFSDLRWSCLQNR